MNFATSLIMACVFFRLFNIPAGGVDLMPDMVGILLAIIAASQLRKKEDDFKDVYIPAGFAMVFSLWNFIDLMPSEASVGFGIIYTLLEGGLLAAETVMYKKLFDGYGSMYGQVCAGGFRALVPYAVSRMCGIAVSIAVWAVADNEELWWVTFCYFVWMIINIVIATYLAYQFYILKPKFRGK